VSSELQYIPAVAAEGEMAMGGHEPFDYYGTARGASATWENSITLASVRELVTLDNMIGADFLSPTPGLIVHGHRMPTSRPTAPARRGNGWAGRKKSPGSTSLHIDLYDTEPYVTQAVDALTGFLANHL